MCITFNVNFTTDKILQSGLESLLKNRFNPSQYVLINILKLKLQYFNAEALQELLKFVTTHHKQGLKTAK